MAGMCDRTETRGFFRHANGVACLVACAHVMSAEAQHEVPILRPDPQEQQHTENIPDTDYSWIRYDTIIDPRRPELGNTSLIPELVAREFGDYMTGEAWEKAEETARILVAIAKDRPASHYNLACALARRGKSDEAFASLERAIELGWRQYEHFAHLDPDLDSLRNDPRFAALVARLEAAIKADLIPATPLRSDPWQAVVADLEQKTPELLARSHVPGATVALIRDGRTVWSGEFGVADERTDEALECGTLFRLEGPARLLAAVLALQLEEQGIWDLDDPLTRWLPEIPLAANDDAKRVTIRSALNFTGGLVHRTPLMVSESIDAEIAQSLSVRGDRIGSMYTYTPQSFLAVGRAVERAIEPTSATNAAESPDFEQFDGYYGQLVQSRILRPLRMTATLMRRPNGKRFNLAVGHTEYGTPYRTDFATPRKPVDPIYSTAGDIAILVESLLGTSDNDHRLLDAESIEAITTPGLPLAPLDTSGEGEHPRGFGLGTMVIDTPHGRCVEIVDLGDGCGSLVRWYPAERCGIVILFNSDTGIDAARRIAHLALGGI